MQQINDGFLNPTHMAVATILKNAYQDSNKHWVAQALTQHGTQIVLNLDYLPPGINYNQIIQGTQWVADNSTGGRWTLVKSIGLTTPARTVIRADLVQDTYEGDNNFYTLKENDDVIYSSFSEFTNTIYLPPVKAVGQTYEVINASGSDLTVYPCPQYQIFIVPNPGQTVGGTFTLTYNTHTFTFPYNVNPMEIQQALISTGDVPTGTYCTQGNFGEGYLPYDSTVPSNWTAICIFLPGVAHIPTANFSGITTSDGKPPQNAILDNFTASIQNAFSSFTIPAANFGSAVFTAFGSTLWVVTQQPGSTGSGYKSLTGSGQTTTPGQLNQSGSFRIFEFADEGGFLSQTVGGFFVQDTNNLGGMNIAELGSGHLIIDSGGGGNLQVAQSDVSPPSTAGAFFSSTGTQGTNLTGQQGVAIAGGTGFPPTIFNPGTVVIHAVQNSFAPSGAIEIVCENTPGYGSDGIYISDEGTGGIEIQETGTGNINLYGSGNNSNIAMFPSGFIQTLSKELLMQDNSTSGITLQEIGSGNVLIENTGTVGNVNLSTAQKGMTFTTNTGVHGGSSDGGITFYDIGTTQGIRIRQFSGLTTPTPGIMLETGDGWSCGFFVFQSSPVGLITPVTAFQPSWAFTQDGHIYFYPTGGPWTLKV